MVIIPLWFSPPHCIHTYVPLLTVSYVANVSEQLLSILHHLPLLDKGIITQERRNMNELQIFNNEEFGEIRTVLANNEPMFCLPDVCKALELSNSRVVSARLDDDERCKLDLPRQGETWFITESGLYAVILRSDKPNAKKFRKWVTSEVFLQFVKMEVI